jgi:transcriptional regulator with XRE-family HTH domain
MSNDLGTRLRRAREEQKLSLSEVARRADISKAYLSQLEKGDSQHPSYEILGRLATALATTVPELAGQSVIWEPLEVDAPASLRAFAQEARLPAVDVSMLARIHFRGKRPTKADDWSHIYETIKRTIRWLSWREGGLVLLNRHSIEAAANTVSIGMLADDATLAALRYLEKHDLDDRDKQVLERARNVLLQVAEFAGRELVTTHILREMTSVRALDETFDAVAEAGASSRGDIAAVISRLGTAIQAIIQGTANDEEATMVRDLFDRLSRITLDRSRQLVRPTNQQRYEWIRAALPS